MGSYGRRLLMFQSLKCYNTPLSRSSFSSLSSTLPILTHHNNHLTHKKKTTFLTQNITTLVFPHFFTRYLSTTADNDDTVQYHQTSGSDEEVEPIDLWEEEDEAEPEIGDGADGGGIALQNCPWGERVLSMAREILLEFNDDIQLFAFKTSPRGYIYVRLDKLSHEYGCPGLDEIESYSRRYKKRLDEVGASGEIPDDLALEVSSPSAERLLRVPDDLHRFKDMPMRVFYVDDTEGKRQEKDGVFLLDLINSDSGTCTWRLANVKENRDPLAKGRPLSRKQKDWRLELPFFMSKRVTLYLDH